MAQVTFTYNPTPAPACYPADVNGLAQLLTTGGMLGGTIPDNSGGGLYVGVTPPPSSITTKVWHRIDGIGRPIGVYMFYSGMWRKVYAGIGIGEIRMWSGSNSVFDGNGLGIVGGDMDGWHLCNGVGGIVDLTNRFVVGSTVYPGQWQSNPDGQGNRSVGGEAVIQCQNLPDLWTTGWAVGVPSSGGPTLVMGNVPTSQAMDIQVTDLINNCHPGGQVGMAPLFYALAFVQFVGY